VKDATYRQTVLSTRPHEADTAFAEALNAAGIGIVNMPMIEIVPPNSWQAIDEAIGALEVYSGVVFTSANAAGFFAGRLKNGNRTPADLPPVFAVGEKTAAALKLCEIECASVSRSGGAAELADALGDVDNQFFLHPTSNIGRTELAAIVESRGGRVNQVTVYNTVQPTYDDIREIDDQLIMGEIDCIAFFSPSAVQHFAALIPGFKQATVLIAAIGQTTAMAAVTAGWRVDVIAPEQTAESLAEAIRERFESNERIQFNDGEQIDLA